MIEFEAMSLLNFWFALRTRLNAMSKLRRRRQDATPQPSYPSSTIVNITGY